MDRARPAGGRARDSCQAKDFELLHYSVGRISLITDRGYAGITFQLLQKPSETNSACKFMHSQGPNDQPALAEGAM
jgi:hypothetical protein